MILTTDNSRDKHLQDIGGCKDDIANLRMIADIKISELKLDDCPNLLVFPRDFTECDDKIGEENIFSLNGDLLKTNNIMGFVGIDKTQVTIKSRFAWDDNEDYFLHYMLQKVFSINLFNLPHNFAEESIFDFLLYLFPLYLKRALRQGLFKEYQRRCYNDANVRGVIDINRHIRFNIPFAGRVAYNTREYSYDNHVTQLIRHTIEFIRMHKFCGNILNSDEKIKEDVSLITSATPTYERNNRQNIINQNLRPLRHPYFSDYIMLQHLCLQILRHEQIKYGVEKDKIYGILFDGAWLWEEYMNTILKDCGFKHPQNKQGKGSIYLFEKPDAENAVDTHSRCKRYPDFYKDDFILDAKYKRLEKGIIDRGDMHQVISYMHVERAKTGGFIYPTDNIQKDGFEQLGILRGYGGEICSYGFAIPKTFDDFTDFCSKMKSCEKSFNNAILSLTKDR